MRDVVHKCLAQFYILPIKLFRGARLREIITIRRRYDSRDEGGGEGRGWVPVNIYCEGNLISEESIFRAMSPGIMIHRERICPCVLFYEARAFATREEEKKEGKKKFAASSLSPGFSYPNNYDAGGAGTYLDAEISFCNVREIFSKDPQSLSKSTPCMISSRAAKVLSPVSVSTRAIEQYNSWCDNLNASLTHKYLLLIIVPFKRSNFYPLIVIKSRKILICKTKDEGTLDSFYCICWDC